MITIELYGLELFGHHGVEEHERQKGQRFLYDVWLDLLREPSADRIEQALDYRRVAACVQEVAGARRFALLETLAAAVAGAMVDRFEVERARVRVRKPDVELDPPVDYSAVTVTRRARS